MSLFFYAICPESPTSRSSATLRVDLLPPLSPCPFACPPPPPPMIACYCSLGTVSCANGGISCPFHNQYCIMQGPGGGGSSSGGGYSRKLLSSQNICSGGSHNSNPFRVCVNACNPSPSPSPPPPPPRPPPPSPSPKPSPRSHPPPPSPSPPPPPPMPPPACNLVQHAYPNGEVQTFGGLF